MKIADFKVGNLIRLYNYAIVISVIASDKSPTRITLLSGDGDTITGNFFDIIRSCHPHQVKFIQHLVNK